MWELFLNLTWLIPVFPLLAFLAITFFTVDRRKLSSGLAIGAMALSLVIATGVLGATLVRLGEAAPAGEHAALGLAAAGEEAAEAFYQPPVVFERDFDWMPTARTVFKMGYEVDPLTAAMVFMVTLVGLLIFIYSQGYMEHDPRYGRFFSFLSLFAASMLALVVANNLLLLFISWELVGLCSYLLIGFWYFKPSAANAAKKAFITTKVGDLGFFLGIALLYAKTGTLSFSEIFRPEVLHELGSTPFFAGMSVATAVGLLLLWGTIGKSGQFPLHVWLPDAMEGPTPVSALIHAATMVAAGIFMVARMYPVFQAGAALKAAAWVGGFTALFAATIALGQYDIKRILAYSTISQLGYMLMALGVGGLVAGMFHLLTHAFFKALLFLGSGSVIHGCHERQDIREMGGLRKAMPVTYWTYMAATFALIGLFPFAGFWSKDEILVDAFLENRAVYALGAAAAFLTAFYMTRQVGYVFFGEQRDHSYHPHESPQVMLWPLRILAFFAIFGGVVGLPWLVKEGTPFANFLRYHAAEFNVGIALSSTAIALAGIFVGWLLYIRTPVQAGQPDPLARILGPVYTWLENKWYIDELYEATVLAFFKKLADGLGWIDKNVVDGLVNLAARSTALISEVGRIFDLGIVDGAVNGVGNLVRVVGREARYLQTGRVQEYLSLAVAAGSLVATVFLFFWR